MKTVGVVGLALVAAVGCKKGGGTGGGGGGWLVGSSALMANVDVAGTLGKGYELAQTAALYRIACRYTGEAWVAGERGTLLYTADAGATWAPQALPTTADLRALATVDDGPVFVAGDHVFLTSYDAGGHWANVPTSASFTALAAAQWGTNVMAIDTAGAVWAFDRGSLTTRATIAGARGLAVSPDGDLVMVAGDGLWLSIDSGHTFSKLDVAGQFEEVRIGLDGSAVAVGAGGAIAKLDAQHHATVQHVGTADLHAVHIPDPDATDGVGYAAGDGGQVLVTHDSGATWTMGPDLGRTVFGIDEIGDFHN